MSSVAVVVPTYNRKEYLKSCLESIVGQTFTDFTVYIFDNRSSYDIEALVESCHDRRIKLVRRDVNVGPMENFRLIFKFIFSEPYVMVFHDDDVMHPKLLEYEIGLLSANPEAAFVGSGMHAVFADRQMQLFPEIQKLDQITCSSDDLARLLLKDYDLCFGSVMYRSSLLDDIEPFQEKYYKWGDRPYLLHMAKKGKAICIPHALVNYRIHVDQHSQQKDEDKIQESFNIFEAYQQALPQPLSRKDKDLLYIFSTNNLLLSGALSANTWRGYLSFLKIARRKKLVHLSYIRLRGLWYMIKVIARLRFKF